MLFYCCCFVLCKLNQIELTFEINLNLIIIKQQKEKGLKKKITFLLEHTVRVNNKYHTAKNKIYHT